MTVPKIKQPSDVVLCLQHVLGLVKGERDDGRSTRLKTAFSQDHEGRFEFLTGLWLFEQSPTDATKSAYANLRLDDRPLASSDALGLIARVVTAPAYLDGLALPKFNTPSVAKVLGRWPNERTEFSGWPEWIFSFSPERKNGGRQIPPSEPVVGRGLRPYASGTQAVLDWVWGRAAPENHLPHENALVVVVPDYRCRIKSAEWRTGRVTTVVEGPEEDLELQVLVQASGGHSPCPPFTDLPRGEPLEVRVPSETERVELFLVRSTGELASHVVLHSAGEEFEAKPGRPTVEEQARADLRGEGQYVEFKPFIEPKHQKEHEVVKSIVAFSNTEGGRLYIGVSNDGVPEGDAALRRVAKADGEAAIKKVVDWVRSLAAEKVKPDPDLEVQAIRVSGEVVILLSIAAGASPPYSTHANDVFIRSGATNRKPDPRTELPNIGSARRGAVQIALGKRFGQ